MPVEPAFTTDPVYRVKIEIQGLGWALMPHQDNNVVKKVVALVFVLLWAAVTLALTLESVQAVAPPHYGLFTALVFLLVGRLWNLEVDRLLPGDAEE